MTAGLIQVKITELTLMATILIASAGCTSFISERSPVQNNQWGQFAQRDLLEARRIILQSHPAVLDTGDRAFHEWLRVGFQEATNLGRQAQSQAQALAAIRYFTTGFQDGHLTVSSYEVPSRPGRWAGFNIQRRGKDFLVADTAKSWPIPLPSAGSKILSCGGQDILKIIHEKIAPFVDRRVYLESTLSDLALHLTNEWPNQKIWEEMNFSSCIFQASDGTLQELDLHWMDGDAGLRRSMNPVSRQGVRFLGNQSYWITASNFMPQGAELDSYESMLNQASQILDAKLVVIDTRGNTGGNSINGYRLLKAILKNNKNIKLVSSGSFWRVSPQSISAIDASLDALRKQQNADKVTLDFIQTLSGKMHTAASLGQEWVEQMDLATEEHQHPVNQSFGGKLVLVTDARCASACLDFAEMVLALPGSIHVGQETSADTKYLEAVQSKLPSGAYISVPVKVWRERLRGTNTPITPEFAYPGDIRDTPSIEAWIRGHVLPIVAGK